MDGILRLAKTYSKKKHTNILPCCDVNILENLHFLYDEDWENQCTILTYLFDCYYVLPQRPELASLFCWQAINHSYYVQQLGISNVVSIKAAFKGIPIEELHRGAKFNAMLSNMGGGSKSTGSGGGMAEWIQ